MELLTNNFNEIKIHNDKNIQDDKKIKCDIKPIKLDILNLRNERQKLNNILTYQSLKSHNISKNININAFNRILENLNFTDVELFTKCDNDDDFCKVTAMYCAINSSRQGSKDEEIQIKTLNITSRNFGVTIKQQNEFRPCKNGTIINNTKKLDCLKSFDGKITGMINGWIFAKVVIGEGGHQDNVYEEANNLCEWILQYNKIHNKGIDEIFIILIDTDLIEKLNELQKKYMYIKNIIIGGHIQIQEYIIKNY